MSRFWAVGVGPGDPQLLTLRAVNVLRTADVIYHAGPEENEGRALAVIRHLLTPQQTVRALLTEPMSAVSTSGDSSSYRPGVERIAADCRRGLQVAFITEGDPTLYSTASHVWQLLAERHPDIPREIIPGVSSITAAAARAGWSLGQKEDLFAVVPANYHQNELQTILERFTTVCFLKVSQVLPNLAQMLEMAGPDYQAVYVENLGTEQEWLTQDLREASGHRNYFSLVLVRRQPVRTATGGQAPFPPGKLWLVGLGPGDLQLLTPRALEVLRSAEVLVGYEAYLQSLAPLGLSAELCGSAIGAETDRAQQALQLARAGKRVVLVSSGDAGVYGMASLVLETAARNAPELDIEMVPGVTAALSAAALLGAPLGHDFACISLSDLLTPWPVIERRLTAAGQGDFVVALYNPVSQRRTWQLPRARDLLLEYRQPQTPVGCVDRAYRPGTHVWRTTLAELTAEGIGMESLIIIGNSQTQVLHGRMVTPRGYGERS